MAPFLPVTGQSDWCPAVTARYGRPLPSRARASAKTIDRGKRPTLFVNPLRDPCLGRHTPPPSSPPLVPVQIGLAVFRREDISIWLTEFICCCARGPDRSWRPVVVRLPLNRPGAGDADLKVPSRTLCSRTDHERSHFSGALGVPREQLALERAGPCASMYVIAAMHASDGERQAFDPGRHLGHSGASRWRRPEEMVGLHWTAGDETLSAGSPDPMVCSRYYYPQWVASVGRGGACLVGLA